MNTLPFVLIAAFAVAGALAGMVLVGLFIGLLVVILCTWFDLDLLWIAAGIAAMIALYL